MREASIDGSRPKRGRRVRTTRASVKVVERIARAAITLGGSLTIVAVGAICVFLVWVVVPLFRGVGASEARASAVASTGDRRVAHTGLDEYGRLCWSVLSGGRVELHELAGGRAIFSRPLFEGAVPTCSAYEARDGALAFGFADGTLRLGAISIDSEIVVDASGADPRPDLAAGSIALEDEGIVERTLQGSLRRERLSVRLDPPVEVGAPLALIDVTILPAGPVIAVLTEAGRLELSSVRRTKNLLTEEETVQLVRSELPFRPAPTGEAPIALKLLGAGDDVLVVWGDGRMVRIDARDRDAPVEVESLDLVPEPGATITTVGFLAGRRTLLVGDSLGRVQGWFKIKPRDAGTLDGARMALGHSFAGPAPITALADSTASRTFAVGDASGEIRLYYASSETLLATLGAPGGKSIEALALAPREDALAASTEDALLRWELDAPHPEASLTALFRPLWYENYQKPEHVWQSSAASDDNEPKHGMMPIVFGTLKATLYSLLFGVPLALLAAVYSSEFLDRRLRVPVKSTIEIMASLPSVVLGFLAAIVIAPFVQSTLAQVLTAFYTVPCALLAGAQAWQLLPQAATVRLHGWPRLVCIAATALLGVAAAMVLGPWLERACFGGSVQAWLDGADTGSFGAWWFLLTPVSVAAVAWLSGRIVGPWVRSRSGAWTRELTARVDLARFASSLLAALALSAAVAAGLDEFGFDPRGSLVGGYVQRNALIVGFVMGFAIIPIIYTLAEDALHSVPGHLRLASLGAGATQWQTAIRIIVPTAASGLFSAVMVGLGRAVGETMIVLMAAGNTPLMELNAFSGFRTLSANIAVELPEAVENSTHYRTLFLAALTLFAITFVVNTAAEVVRQRFRKRAFQL